MREFAATITAAWKARKKKHVGNYSTDGTTVYAYGTPVATRALDGRRYIVTHARGDMATHLIGCLRAAFPRAIAVEKIDVYYSSIYEPTVHYPPRRPPHKIRVEKPPPRQKQVVIAVAKPDGDA